LLPIYADKDTILNAVSRNSAVIIEAPTGSGKTTQIPQILFHAGYASKGLIGVTQPRRIAAVTVSRRIAEEMSFSYGSEVGYKIRFDDFTSEMTRIKIMTDGILLQEIKSDPLLSRYSVLMIDEAHERSLNIDFILGLLKPLMRRRPDIRIIVSSATINTQEFSYFFNNAPVVSVKSRTFPVTVNYLPPYSHEELLPVIYNTVNEIASGTEKGDILIFLWGENVIKECCAELKKLAMRADYRLRVLPLYARLSPEEQADVFRNFPGERKVIAATNIAETSITIDGVRFVIDSGIANISRYNPNTFTSRLETMPVSRASCEQRSGRAGRTGPGTVYRLYAEDDYKKRDEYTLEEIHRSDLSEVLLRMADLGIYDYFSFDFISPPAHGLIRSALETLRGMNALDAGGNLTEIGKQMAEFPIPPRLSRILLESMIRVPQSLRHVITVISFLTAKSPFLYPAGKEAESRKAQKKLIKPGGDFFTWISLFDKYSSEKDKENFCRIYFLDERVMREIFSIHAQIISMVRERHIEPGSEIFRERINSCFCTGLYQYVCLRSEKNDSYRSCTEKGIRIHPASALFSEKPEAVVGGEIVHTGRVYIRSAAVIKPEMLKNNFSDLWLNLTRRHSEKKRFPVHQLTERGHGAVSGKIQIGGKYFFYGTNEFQSDLILPYHILIQLREFKTSKDIYQYRKIKAVLTFKGICIARDRLGNIFKYFDLIDFQNGLNTKRPKQSNCCFPEDWAVIKRYLDSLLKPVYINKKKQKTAFFALSHSAENLYTFSIHDDFYEAVELCLESMDNLFMENENFLNSRETAYVRNLQEKFGNILKSTDNQGDIHGNISHYK